MDRSGRATAVLILALVAIAGAGAWFLLSTRAQQTLIYPDPAGIADSSWLDARADDQFRAVAQRDVFADFRFTDRLEASGITFLNRVVLDAAKTYKPVHYDHGNGVPVADVDGDGLLDVYFVNQVGANGLFRNNGDGTFRDITASAGVAVADAIGVSASFADVDNDGDPDLYVTVVRDGNRLFENDGTGRFTDISQSSGLDYRGHSSGAVFFDYDRDGLLDLFVTNVGTYTEEALTTVTPEQSGVAGDPVYEFHLGFGDAFSGHLMEERHETSRLYHNDGEMRFTDVTEAMGLVEPSFSGDATPMDANGDGWIDLYVLDMQGDDEYFENVAGGAFVHRTAERFPVTPWGSMGVKSFDFDGDGDMDLLLTDMHSDMSQQIGPDREKEKAEMLYTVEDLANGGYENSIYGNALFRAEADGSFTEVSDAVGAENYWPWGLSVGDLNADGYDDVFIASSMNYPWRYGVNSVLLNERGESFVDAEFAVGVEPRRNGMMQHWFDVDCAAGEGQVQQLARYCEAAPDQVVQVWGALGSRSSAIFDLEGDGDLDIVTNEFHGVPMVLISNLTESRVVRWLEIELEGTASNRDGTGAVVRVTAGGRTQTKVNDGVSGYMSHSVQPLYFGLDAAETVDRVEVTWPSGRVQVVEGPLESGRRMTITEG